MGQGMMAVAFLIALGLLTVFFSGVEDNQRNPNQSPDSIYRGNLIEVVLERNRQGHYLVIGQINGRDAEFLLDTGATDVVVPEPLANELGLTKGRPGRAMTANGPVTVYDTRISDLKIGNIHLQDVNASINPGMRNQEILLGMSALKQIEFVQRGSQLTLRQVN
jgi:aspartyl protease family protein